MSKELGVAKKTVKQIQIVKLLNGKFVKKKKKSKVVWGGSDTCQVVRDLRLQSRSLQSPG